ncbi:hypothetical protein GUJ93_ZPchr0008g11618 [Zizania palustris]|uniref:Late embryogenesis abundant protein LEA-2 subgroup domain-containing protein n=1 Tax=Zizania palustris TaxID=103762 RepID=A0A8J5UX61_ZIZPA|nr:hypothetical protein GUJ93_ZPchr0008g11618 [Zizania palustris]
MATPYHLQSPRTIIAKLMNMKQHPAALPQPPEPEPPKLILQPRHRTTPAMWCAAIFCFAFSILLIIAGVVILIVFLVVKPRAPSFDAASATLNAVYVGSPPYVNGDMTLVANVSNPNQKIDVVFRSAAVELFFRGRLMAAQALPPFAQRRGQSRIVDVRMVSSQVMLPPDLAVEMLNQMKSNRVVYTIRGKFKVQASIWFWHYTYWMYALCDLELTAPPCGVLVARRCSTR